VKEDLGRRSKNSRPATLRALLRQSCELKSFHVLPPTFICLTLICIFVSALRLLIADQQKIADGTYKPNHSKNVTNKVVDWNF
jgi:hypothetical protein